MSTKKLSFDHKNMTLILLLVLIATVVCFIVGINKKNDALLAVGGFLLLVFIGLIIMLGMTLRNM